MEVLGDRLRRRAKDACRWDSLGVLVTTSATDSTTFLDSDRPRPASPSRVRSLLEWVAVIVLAVGAAMLIKTFVMQAFYIPTGSMQPTLEINDRVLVNKLSYRLHDVNRGDIVVFERLPQEVGPDNTKDLIKRVIGLPGESIVIKDDRVYVNGAVLDEPYLPPGTHTVNTNAVHPCTTETPCVVPPDSVWVMGDNRSSSQDSRVIGPIPIERIVGRAFVRVWPLSRFGGI
jgi:signal peptidase I